MIGLLRHHGERATHAVNCGHLRGVRNNTKQHQRLGDEQDGHMIACTPGLFSADNAHVMSTSEIVFYTAKVCPYAQREEIAFQEAKSMNSTELGNKPEWYASWINPARKVPAVVYGSAKSDPENPSPESARLTKSLALLEFVADLYPDSGLLPNDPVECACVRFFIDTVSTKVFPPLFASPTMASHRMLSSRRLPTPAAAPACCPIRCRESLHDRRCCACAVPWPLGTTPPQRPW
ncbi:hypothetical protein EDB83DRAFT_876708 [Lactarius deliciosus]|nr:hypothetical protein EDB83DRAFT_876708 [Lactarius deliciosus]